mgnify:CR=1 FL=1
MLSIVPAMNRRVLRYLANRARRLVLFPKLHHFLELLVLAEGRGIVQLGCVVDVGQGALLIDPAGQRSLRLLASAHRCAEASARCAYLGCGNERLARWRLCRPLVATVLAGDRVLQKTAVVFHVDHFEVLVELIGIEHDG